MGQKERLTNSSAGFWAAIIAQAWEDDQFKAKLLRDPEKALMEKGFYSENIKVEETAGNTMCSYDAKANTLYLPMKPDGLKNIASDTVFFGGMAPFC